MQAATHPQDYEEKRSEPRILSKGTAALTAGQLSQEVLIIDISRSGMQVELPEPIEVGTEVTLKFQGMAVLGDVGNCRRQGDGRFRAGIRTRRVLDRKS